IASIFITVVYSAISGLWGVMVTDFFQFLLAMGMAIVLAIVSLNAAGGLDSILDQLPQIYGPENAAAMTRLLPSFDTPEYGFTIFLLYILLLWWTVGGTDGGAYLAQRMIAAKNEKHSFLGYLWYNIGHFCLRPWPWILVGLVAAVKFPGIAARNPISGVLEKDPELGYIAVMLTNLKPGLLGLMLASFLAAFMSTISTQINWGASYLINDFYKPYINPTASEKHYIRVSIFTVVLMAILGGAISFLMTDIFFAWLLLSAINAGIGIVYIARWYWWRINAYSEISAIMSILITVAAIIFIQNESLLQIVLTSIVGGTLLILFLSGFVAQKRCGVNPKSALFIFVIALIAVVLVTLVALPEKKFPWTLIYTVPISLTVWLSTTLLTKPVEEHQLIKFYRRVHPGGPGWKKISEKIPEDYSKRSLFTWRNLIAAISGIVAVYSVLLGIGYLLLGKTIAAAILSGVLLLSVFIMIKNLSEEQWKTNSNNNASCAS
ncbi:MAG: hypothetical protein SCK70_11050, partial [bacterium]|nr:hypothetical protein [bacterium]